MRLRLSVIAFALAMLGGTSQAFAWGVCGRGPWVYYSNNDDAVDSICTCSDGTAGLVRTWGYNEAMMQWFAGSLSAGIGGEYEVTYDYDDDGVPDARDFLPMISGYDDGLAHSGWYQGDYYYWSGHPYHLEDTPPYTPHLTGRFRSVCIANYGSLVDNPPDPYGYRWD